MVLYFDLCVGEEVRCPSLPQPTNGYVFYVVTQGGTASYGCNYGYHLVGVSGRTCGADGTWSGSAPTCIRMYKYVVLIITVGHRPFPGHIAGMADHYQLCVNFLAAQQTVRA